jgi:plasmid maintenance system antidote protein VapI
MHPGEMLREEFLISADTAVRLIARQALGKR